MAKIKEKYSRSLFELCTSLLSKFQLPSKFRLMDEIFEKQSTELVCSKCDSSSALCMKIQKYQNTIYTAILGSERMLRPSVQVKDSKNTCSATAELWQHLSTGEKVFRFAGVLPHASCLSLPGDKNAATQFENLNMIYVSSLI